MRGQNWGEKLIPIDLLRIIFYKYDPILLHIYVLICQTITHHLLCASWGETGPDKQYIVLSTQWKCQQKMIYTHKRYFTIQFSVLFKISWKRKTRLVPFPLLLSPTPKGNTRKFLVFSIKEKYCSNILKKQSTKWSQMYILLAYSISWSFTS